MSRHGRNSPRAHAGVCYVLFFVVASPFDYKLYKL
jgi:hypothetical protein